MTTADAATALLATSQGSFFYIPTLNDFFPPAILFEGTIFQFDRIQLVRLVVVAVTLTFLCLVASRATIVPGRVQSIVEAIVEFVDKNIIVGTLGLRDGAKYGPMLMTMFFLIFVMNLAGLVPGLNIPGSSVIGLPLLLALWTFATYVFFGIKHHGLGGYLRHATAPPGVPKVVYLLLIPIEVIQVFIVRWASLTIRLLANMIGGHMIIVVLLGITNALVLSMSWLVVISPAAIALSLGVFAFKLFVAGLQAFIFTILSAVYIQMAISDEH
ncbi:MAG: F0F1 ATP synthase subunit A [Brachybacterium sp.]|nr:F0F1 ATP synthase subunit A [Brachybacterium sp.]